MILVSFFSEDNVLSDDIQLCYIFEYQSNENRVFRFLGTPGIVRNRIKQVFKASVSAPSPKGSLGYILSHIDAMIY